MNSKYIPPTPFLDCRDGVSRHRTLLPHWQQEGRIQFVTWSLGDAVPGPVLKKWKEEKDLWLSLHPKPWSEEEIREYGERFGERLDIWLDKGHGACLLRSRLCAELVTGVILASEGDAVRLDSFVVMPNHVHVLFQLINDAKLERLLQQWKGISSHRINNHLKCKGTVWMRDYWDRMIRGPEHFRHVRKYILNNPAKAGLKDGSCFLWKTAEPLWDQLKNEGFRARG